MLQTGRQLHRATITRHCRAIKAPFIFKTRREEQNSDESGENTPARGDGGDGAKRSDERGPEETERVIRIRQSWRRKKVGRRERERERGGG